MKKLETVIFFWMLKRYLRNTDQWDRFVIRDSGVDWFVEMSMIDDGYFYRRIRA